MPGQQPPPTPASTPAMATPANAAPVPVNSSHLSRDMTHLSSVKRDSNVPSLNSGKIKFHDAASKQNPEPDKNSAKQNNSQKLKFSIDAILNKRDYKKLLYQLLKQKKSCISSKEPRKKNNAKFAANSVSGF